METIDIRKLNKNTVSEQVLVYMDAFNHDMNEYNELISRWEIKHYDNPFGESYIFGAFDGDKLVGMNSFMPLKYCYMGKNVNVVQSCESGVLKSYQRKGIWQQIMIYAEDYFKKSNLIDAVIGFPNYENSYPGFLKMGYETLYFERNMLMVCNGKLLVKAILGQRWWSAFVRIAEIQKSYAMIVHQMTKEYSVKKSLNEEIPLAKKECLSFPANKKVIEWKRYKSLQVIDVLHKGRAIARFYGYEGTQGRAKYFMLSKCYRLVANMNETYCYATVINYLSQMDYAFIRTWYNVFCKNPFIGFIEIKRHKNPFIIKLMKEDLEYLRNPFIWDVGILDLD